MVEVLIAGLLLASALAAVSRISVAALSGSARLSDRARIEAAIKELKIAISLNPQDAGAWLTIYSCYKEVGLIEESQKAYSKYEAILNEPELQEAPGGDNPANIPGGVSHTSKLANGEDLRDNSAGLESLRESGE